jgi:septum formation protein
MKSGISIGLRLRTDELRRPPERRYVGHITFPQGYAVSLILASASSIRKAMLEAADVPFRAEPSRVNESSRKREIGDPRQTAIELAKAKALDVSERNPAEWVIGSDSVVNVDGRLFDKPGSREDAADHLQFFSGRAMELTSAVALVCDGAIDWVHSQTARLHVRRLSAAFIEAYLDKEWPEVGYCVGVFRMEARGVQLFDRIEGDHFTILGMPLIPLLTALRERGLVEQ